MRMKRKKNLDERIAASSDYLITMKNDSLDFQDAIKEILTKTFFALKETGTC